jgi:hypothetical protein
MWLLRNAPVMEPTLRQRCGNIELANNIYKMAQTYGATPTIERLSARMLPCAAKQVSHTSTT